MLQPAGRTALVIATLVAFLFTTVPPRAEAALIGTQDALAAAAGEPGGLARVESALARADVQAQLTALGVEPAEAALRARALTETELNLLADHLESLPAGGDLLAVIGIVFVVLLILELVGAIDLFKKIP
jgi:hypothetical protein